ncbi:type II toxin-antitoxin system RelE/ParE family toxin [Marinitoga sp. 38H-ov]|jgi:mRNA interferase RelE/StbE|uniref:type II toxin-antitoxin system RelE family toxin n=1 Tax=Marinitoga sp. 38H-ov TaxID=1755814 RepID=UPI0013ED47ED|nr:type II toxin-antitoxin system RelE/ParE family toxin [Marinitoga sp. 38H-ov]
MKIWKWLRLKNSNQKWELHWTKKAYKSFEKIDPKFQKQIKDDLKELINYYNKDVELSLDVKKLKDEGRGFFRLRSGDYRIIFTINHGKLVILIINVMHRKDVYTKKHFK